MSPKPSLWLAPLPLLLDSSVRAQSGDAQSRFWNGAMQGDTVAMAQALREGAVIDSLDTRRNRNGRRALNWTAWYNQMPAIDFLLAHGAPLEARIRTGFTALHHAAEAGSLGAAWALLAAGADRNTVNEAGRKPVETARLKGHEEMVRLRQEAAD